MTHTRRRRSLLQLSHGFAQFVTNKLLSIDFFNKQTQLNVLIERCFSNGKLAEKINRRKNTTKILEGIDKRPKQCYLFKYIFLNRLIKIKTCIVISF